jgi:CBS-domain-containing membrane protein
MVTVNARQREVLAGLLGAIIGGLVVVVATKAVPRMMSNMRAGMMKNMMQMKGKDGNFPDI